jgi:7-carboxy-7-deazaguanine synthase
VRVSEVYESIQGEGEFSGEPSVFVRTTGCNLRCWFCDTPYTSWNPEGEPRSIDDLCEQIFNWSTKHVVITGGEPMIQPDVVELAQRLIDHNRFVTIETAGSVDLNVSCQLMSISPKLSNSTPSIERDAAWSVRHEESRHRPEVIRRLISDYKYQFKFVIDSEPDVAEVQEYLKQFPEIDLARVWLMPQAITQEQLAAQGEWLKDQATAAGFQYSTRLQIEMFGNVRGT